jgi:hypothetical protein
MGTMARGQPMTPAPKDSSRRFLGANRATAMALAVLTLVQAVSAARSNRLFGSWSITVHGAIGNAVFVIALAGLGLALLRRGGRAAVMTAGGLAFLVTAQIGLGYLGRTSLEAAAWHVPTGVAIFGVTIYNLMLALPREPSGLSTLSSR